MQEQLIMMSDESLEGRFSLSTQVISKFEIGVHFFHIYSLILGKVQAYLPLVLTSSPLSSQ